MKKVLSLFLVLVMAFSCALMITGCKPNDPGDGDGMTRDEIAATYKEVAESAWQAIGYDNPVQPSLMSAIPDKKVETTDTHEIANIKSNVNSAIGIIYMIGSLYENDAFVVEDGVAKFNASVTVFGDPIEYGFTLKSELDVENNKVYLEAIAYVMGTEQYNYAEIDYNFDQKQVTGLDFVSHIALMGQAVNMALTAEGKYTWYQTNDATDSFMTAVLVQKAQLVSTAESIDVLTENFGAECQVYFDILATAIPSSM